MVDSKRVASVTSVKEADEAVSLNMQKSNDAVRGHNIAEFSDPSVTDAIDNGVEKLKQLVSDEEEFVDLDQLVDDANQQVEEVADDRVDEYADHPVNEYADYQFNKCRQDCNFSAVPQYNSNSRQDVNVALQNEKLTSVCEHSALVALLMSDQESILFPRQPSLADYFIPETLRNLDPSTYPPEFQARYKRLLTLKVAYDNKQMGGMDEDLDDMLKLSHQLKDEMQMKDCQKARGRFPSITKSLQKHPRISELEQLRQAFKQSKTQENKCDVFTRAQTLARQLGNEMKSADLQTRMCHDEFKKGLTGSPRRKCCECLARVECKDKAKIKASRWGEIFKKKKIIRQYALIDELSSYQCLESQCPEQIKAVNKMVAGSVPDGRRFGIGRKGLKAEQIRLFSKYTKLKERMSKKT